MNRKFLQWIKVLSVVVVFAVCFGLAGSAHAAYKIGTDETYLKIGGLLQTQLAVTEDGAPNGKDVGTEFYVRRMRIMLYGQLNKWVNFFVETDNPNFGKNADFTPRMFIQDAYLELNLHQAIQVDVGMLLMPFSHHGYQGATSLMGLDYHVPLFKYAPGGSFIWRDYGVMVRGMPLGKWFEYRVGVYNGVHGKKAVDVLDETTGDVLYKEMEDPRNAKDLPRFVGRLVFNIFEPEGGPGVGGMFNDGLYIRKTPVGIVSTRKVLAIGFSADWQADVNVTWKDAPAAPAAGADPEERGFKSEDYYAFAGDVFLDLPLGAQNLMSLNGQVNFMYYNHGDRSNPNAYYNVAGDKKAYTGYGILSEIGFRYDIYQPLLIVDWYQSEGAYNENRMVDGIVTPGNDNTLGDHLGIYGGMNFWVWGHSCNFKVQFGGKQVNGENDFGLEGRLQAQLLF